MSAKSENLTCTMPLSQRFRFITVFVFCLPLFLHGKAADNTGSEPIVLRNADSLSVNTRDSIAIRELSGHVHLDQGNTSVYCDHATQYLNDNHIILRGSVRIVQGTVTMSMPAGDYYGATQQAEGVGGVRIDDRKTVLTADHGSYDVRAHLARFYGLVHVEDDSVRIDADSATYDKQSQESRAYGHVILGTKFSSTWVRGDSALNVPATSYSVMRGRPVLVHIDSVPKDGKAPSDSSARPVKPTTTPVPKQKTTKAKDSKSVKKPSSTSDPKSSTKDTKTKSSSTSIDAKDAKIIADSAKSRRIDSTQNFRYDTLCITADVMQSFRAGGEERFAASKNVELVRGTLSARSGRCVYDRRAESIDLQDGPQLWADSLQLSADSMWVSVPDKRLRAIHAHHAAFMLLRDSSSGERSQQIAGESILIDVMADTIRSVRSIRDAKSLYFMNGDQGPDGASRTVCDSIFIVFQQGKVDDIIWRSGVSSDYYPENLVGHGIRSYYLPSYRLLGSRPRKPEVLLPQRQSGEGKPLKEAPLQGR